MNLFKLNRAEAEGKEFCFDITFNPDDVIAKAHFPTMPIVPGACLVQVVQSAVELYLGRPVTLTSLQNVKFLQTVSPVENKTGLKVSGTFADGTVSAIIESDTTIYTKCKLSVKS